MAVLYKRKNKYYIDYYIYKKRIRKKIYGNEKEAKKTLMKIITKITSMKKHERQKDLGINNFQCPVCGQSIRGRCG